MYALPRAAASRVAAALAILLAAGCGPELPITHREPLPDAATTLYVDADGGVWTGGPGSLARMGGPAAATPGDAAPRVVGEAQGRLYARAGDTLLGVERATGRVLAARGVASGLVVVDPRARFLYRTVEGGGVLGHHPETLVPLWGWAERGAPTTAAAASPLGDRLYQALDRGSLAEVVVRDALTGRILAEHRLSGPVRALATDAAGDLYAVLGEGLGVEVASLRPLAGRLTLRWRRGIGTLDGDVAVRLRVSPRRDRVAVLSGERENGLHVLDAETGEGLGSTRVTPLDVAFAPDGGLYLLYPGELRRAR